MAPLLLPCLAACALACWRWPAPLAREYIAAARALDEPAPDEATTALILAEATRIVGDDTPWDVASVLAVNAGLFARLRVRYDPERTRVPNQAPHETLERGAATCTGLSLVLVTALRGMGVAARVVGTAEWEASDDPARGNHNCASRCELC